jgi:c-di-GMP-binding flagellar brake protein YcgR
LEGNFLSVDKRLQINLKIGLTREGKEANYISSIQDVVGNEIHIAIPYCERIPLDLKSGDIVTVNFTGESELYSFKAKVLGKQNDVIPLYRLTMSEQIKRIQRRKYVRIPVRLRIMITQVDAVDENLSEGDEPNIVRSVDISAGGMKFYSGKRYSLNKGLLVEFFVTKQEHKVQIKALAKIVRCQKINVQGITRYLHSIEFTGIGPGQQDDIFHYVFTRMREIGRMLVSGKRGD